MNIPSPKIFIGVLMAIIFIAVAGVCARADVAEASDKQVIYKVKRGDTLLGIANHFRTTVKAIKRANSLQGNRIYIGQRLKVPLLVTKKQGTSSCGKIYTIRKGDTLAKIAKTCQISVRRLRKLNQLPASARLTAGQKLRLTANVKPTAPTSGTNQLPKVKPINTRPVALPTPSLTS